MNLHEVLTSSLDSIRQNKLRSFLTLLGVVIGMFSIIGVMTAINVLQKSVESNLNVLGTNTFFIQKYPAVQMGGGTHWKYRNRKNLTYADYLQLKDRFSGPATITAENWHSGDPIKFEDKRTKNSVGIRGVTPEWEFSSGYFLQSGRMITRNDLEQMRNVIILGQDVVDVLMPQYNPVGQTVTIRGVKFKVIGTLERKGSIFGQSEDHVVIIPLTTHLKMFASRWTSLGYAIAVMDMERFEEVQEEIVFHLRLIRSVPLTEENDFEVVSNTSLIDTFNQVTGAIKMAALLISSIALIAAGIGIMNIMLVSVTERTREIGIRKSMGARKRDIMNQFLLESLVLTEMGALIGIVLGILAGNLVAVSMDVSGVFPVQWAIIGVVMCSVIGVVFGTYPAVKAAKLDPIEALRYE
ncbi:MAG: putative transport system permease protein [Candidatus Marinimicrobia bacterium]|jgi:putative ABC transport system permease protein|nr:putative transport system permease protein [Candidatus Neomarinimicrobiota bacterium]